VALVAGVSSAIVGGLHLANSAGGLGTGNGVAGAAVALVLGLIGMVVGGLALARSRRHAQLQTTAP
jgi:Zn-dependent protease with chaperone function